MRNGNDTHETADSSPLLRETRSIVAALPTDDTVAAAGQIATAIAVMTRNSAIAPQHRFDALCVFDEAAATHTGLLLQEYLNTPRHTRQRESELWQGAYRYWCELATAYALCAQTGWDSSAAGGVPPCARVAVARAIRALRRQLQWLRIRYAPPPPPLWASLAALLLWSEAAGITENVVLYAGVNTTLQREVLKALALAVLTGDNLMPPEQAWVNHLVKRYANDFALSRSPEAGSTHSFDVNHSLAPVPLGAATTGANLRYFGAGAALASLGEALRTLEQQQTMPAALGFTRPVEPALLAPVLRQIYLDWSGKPLERRQQREKTNARVSVLHGFKDIAQEIDRSMADPLDFTAKAAGESWIASDFSPDGFGVVMPAVSGDWVSVGSLLGILGEAAGAWSVGMVRRVRRLDAGQQHIGVQVLSWHAQAVRVMRQVARAGLNISQRMPIELGILLSADAAQQKEIELLVSDAELYREGNLYVPTADGVLLVALRDVLEVTADCARIGLTVLGVER